MAAYVLDHHLGGEGARLELMSELLDPMHRRLIETLGVGPGDRTLEVGCGNGSVSAWLAQLVAPTGHAVAVDLDLSLVDWETAAMVELRQADIVAAPVDPGTFDLVTARAVLHHVTDPDRALQTWSPAWPQAGRSCSSSPTSSRSPSPNPSTSGPSGTPGWSGPGTTGSTTTSVARWRRGSRSWGCRTCPVPRKRLCTRAVRPEPPIGSTP